MTGRLRARIDTNQPEIVNGLRQLGISCQPIHTIGHGAPDLIAGTDIPCPQCGYAFPQNLLFEIKGPKGTLTDDEEKWHKEWRGQVVVIRNIEDALRTMRKTCPV